MTLAPRRIGLDDLNDIPDLGIARDNGSGDPDSWKPVNLNLIPEEPPTKPTLGTIGDVGLCYPGHRHVFSGPQESAKTLAAYIVALQVIREGGTVVLIDFEMGSYSARDRFRDLGATPDDLNNLCYLEPDQPATDERLTALLAYRPHLVIVDAAAGAYSLEGLDDNKRADVERIARIYVRIFWRNGVATILIDHVVKNTETRGNYAIGSERKVGGADVHLGFSVITPISRGHRGRYKITTHKDRGGYLKRGTLADLELHSDPDTHKITWELTPAETLPDGQEWMPTKVMERISGILQQQDEPISRNALVSLAGGKKTVALTAIDQLIRLRYATETDGPRNSKPVKTSRPFTVSEWERDTLERPVPTGSPPVPGTSHPLVPTGSPPYRGNGTSDALPEPPLVPGHDDSDVPF